MIESIGDPNETIVFNNVFNYINLFCVFPLFHYFCLLIFIHQYFS